MLDGLLRNWSWKLLAVALAYAIWIAVTGESRVMMDVEVPLDVRLDEDAVLAGTPPTTVMARLRGPEATLRRADLLRLELPVDLMAAAPGTHNVQLDRRDLVGVPGGVEVAFLQPDRLALQLDRRLRKSVPVLPTFRGSLPEGYAFYGARVVPDHQEVEGPTSSVAPLERLRTDPIDLRGHTSSFRARVRAVPDSPQVRLVEPDPLEVQVEVDAAPITRRIDLPVVLAGQGYEATASPASVAVTLSGPPSVVERLRPAQIRAVADVAGLAPGTDVHKLPIRVEFVDVDPSELARMSVQAISSATVVVHVSERRSSP